MPGADGKAIETLPAAIPHLPVKLGAPELVVPAGPTDNAPLFLSNIDQVLAFSVETVYFYPYNPEKCSSTVAATLREALAKVLLHYPFLAGRLRLNQQQQRLEVDCNRAGAQFGEAQTHLRISDLGDIAMPNPAFRSLVPQASAASSITQVPLLMVQVTRFACGGFSVGFTMGHINYDGIGAIEFLKNYTSLCKGGDMVTLPNHDRTLLQARNPPTPMFHHPEYIAAVDIPVDSHFTTAEVAQTELQHLQASTNHVYEAFPFSNHMLEVLKAKAGGANGTRPVSTFEALAAHIWQARCKAVDCRDPSAAATLLFAVDIRNRVEPPLPPGFCANAVFSACARATFQELRDEPLGFCVTKVREAIDGVTGDYVRSSLDWWELNRGIPALPGGIFISAWWKLPFYQVDFGWGRPLFAGPVVSNMTEFVLLLPPAPPATGLNVIIALLPHEMDRFRKFIHV